MEKDEQGGATRARINGGMLPIILFGITIVINCGVAISTLWVKAGYVSKEEFEAYRNDQLNKREQFTKEIQGIAVDIGKIVEAMKANDRQDRRLDELERRTGELERRR